MGWFSVGYLVAVCKWKTPPARQVLRKTELRDRGSSPRLRDRVNMIEAITFIDDTDPRHEKRISFLGYEAMKGLSAAIPRAGELVVARKGEEEIVGTVRKVDWYFSSGNYGAPVITVYLNTVNKSP